ncbi:PaaI family thioesterase [Nocardia jiangxiensis]|uniref:PaaI family thioesterase n=1 Tax=Nocardia jiangxiensis TaxID=282685 RepID=A0ABW6S8R3_9NOCA|nr:acyl-CoA thioesterase domain-containing protein [Nocardia jiangxiensis]
MSHTPHATLDFLINGAEALVRVQPVDVSAEWGELIVESGPWLRDPAAGFARGALAVPLDDVTGYIVAAGSPRDSWPVSLGIRIDLVADPPVDGSQLVVTGELVARDDRGGTTRGTVVDSTGAVIALITQRSHLVPVEGPPTAPVVAFDAPPDGVCIRDALGIREPSRGVVEMPGTVLSANGIGNVHGGILICGAEFAAMSALGADGDLRSTSIDMAFVRPGSADETTTFRTEVMHTGRSLAVVRVVATAATGKACAIGTVTVQRVSS